ncbi:unnamed protein product, partial [Prorocentrum cordatum]
VFGLTRRLVSGRTRLAVAAVCLCVLVLSFSLVVSPLVSMEATGTQAVPTVQVNSNHRRLLQFPTLSVEIDRLKGLVASLVAIGDQEATNKYRIMLGEKESALLAARAPPPLEQQVNRAFHNMRTLEACLGKAVGQFEATQKLLAEQRERVQSISSELEQAEAKHKELVQREKKELADRTTALQVQLREAATRLFGSAAENLEKFK